MARKVLTVLTCDLHDKEVEAVESVAFAVRGTSFELDLCAAHAKKFDEALSPFLGVARQEAPARRSAGGRRSTPAGRSPKATGRARRDDIAKVREWARANGHSVADRGRIPATITAEYEAATG